MLETSARLLRLLALLQSRSFWSGADLAHRLEVTERTLRRDIDRLRGLGYPVNSSTGVAGGYQLGAGASLPPLLLDDDEALAVALGLRSAAAGTVTGMEEAAVRALAKLEQVLPARLRKRITAWHAAVAPLAYGGPPVPADTLTALAGACRSEEAMRFDYSDAEQRPTRRHVEPYGLVHTTSRWYLVAWDLDRENFRTFRVDRIAGKCALTGKRFAARKIPGGSPAGYVSRSVSGDAYTYRARVVLHAPLHELAPRVPPAAARLEAIDENRCLLEAGAHQLHTLALHIALLGVDFEIQEPPELMDHLRVISRRLARAAKRDTSSKQ